MSTYLLVGAHSAIAQALTQRLRAEGHDLVLWSRAADLDGVNWVGDVVADELPALPGPLDGVAYFPGTLELRPFARIPLDAFRHDWEVNVLGLVRVLQHTLPALQRGEAASGTPASVVAVSTVAVASGFAFHASIAQAKGGVEALVRALAAEFAPKIRFNAVAPSLTETPLTAKLTGNEERRAKMDARHPLGRIGQPDDVAAAMHYLLGPQSAWTTGQVLAVDGGTSTLRV